MSKQRTDIGLVVRVSNKHDTEAYSELYDRYVERIYRFVFFKVSHAQDAEDITSDVFLRTWNYLTSGEQNDVKSFRALIYKISRNAIVDWYRQRARMQDYVSSDPEIVETVVSNHAPLGDLIDSQFLLNELTHLKQEYQEVVLLRYIEQMSISEIAQIMEKKRTAVRVTLHRAMKKLRQQMENKNRRQQNEIDSNSV